MVQMPEPGQTFNISQLTAATGLSRRTIHFYVQSEMIPPPEGSGRYAVYTEEHFLKLLAIQMMKTTTHLRLRGIREILDPLTLDELRQLVRKQLGQSGGGEGGLHGGPPAPTLKGSRSMLVSRMELGEIDDASELTLEEEVGALERPAPMMPAGFLRDSAPREDIGSAGPPSDAMEMQESFNTWTRLSITKDLEIHFRPTGDSRFLRNVTRLVQSARRLFKK